MKPQTITSNSGNDTFEAYFFNVPMMHEDWHTADELGLMYVGYIENGPNYWDDNMVFTHKEHPNYHTLAEKWLNDFYG